jgi:hypothetical protein
MATQRELYEQFKALHEQKDGFIMPNPWDGALKTRKGGVKHGRYTDEYQRRDGKWWCIGANVISEKLWVL